ncbi:MAG: hypothetical protein ACK500_02910 [Flavobacteriales bacterium]
MTGQELKIAFRHDKAYLTADRPLSFEQLNLPKVAKSFKEPAYWTIRVLSHRANEKKIFCEITSYHVGEIEFGDTQKSLADTLNGLEIITFRSIDTDGLFKTLTGKAGVVRPTPHETVYRSAGESGEPTEHTPNTEPAKLAPPPRKVIIRETFYVPLKDVRFKLGGVSLDKKFKEHPHTLELTIPNYDIREEFDAVKNYFANVLKTKKIGVTAHIEITDGEVTSMEATSPEIEKIDKELIDNVKFEFVKSTTKKRINVELDKSVFTMDEYFDRLADEKFKSNAFYNNDKELFEDLLAISNTKHYKHLRFLSSKHSHDIMKLRFVHKPFSFIFLIQGERNYHIVWETLDTEEATYVWHIAKDINVLKMTLRKIEDIINVIKVQGKTAYISSTEDAFRRIYHDYSNMVDGFVKWKGELESVLT